MQHNSGPQAKIHCEHRAIGVWELGNGKKMQILVKEVKIWSVLLMIKTVIIIILLIIYSPTHNCKHFWILYITISSVVMSNSLQPRGLQHARPPCPSSTAGVYPNSCPLCRPLGLPRWFNGKESACQAGWSASVCGLGRSLEKKMVTLLSLLAWEISWT